MKDWEELFEGDMKRYKAFKPQKKDWMYQFLFLFRRSGGRIRMVNRYYCRKYQKICEDHGVEIPKNTVIGKGLNINHPYCITINKNAKLGENINIHKGVTIGQENRGQRKGAPTIGNKVWIGVNATIVGLITIGDDVLIAPNSYVNCDVPSHSIVIGNPCRVIAREDATKDYINNLA